MPIITMFFFHQCRKFSNSEIKVSYKNEVQKKRNQFADGTVLPKEVGNESLSTALSSTDHLSAYWGLGMNKNEVQLLE